MNNAKKVDFNKFTQDDWEAMSVKKWREIVRRDEWTGEGSRIARGAVLTNLAVIPKEYAFEFLLFCNRNWGAFPVIDVTDAGDPHPKFVAPDADLRTDLPGYNVYINGELADQPPNIKEYWRDDLVAFCIGCGGTFLWSLEAANIKYGELGDFTTNIPMVPAGRFHGNLGVETRVYKNWHDVVRSIQISSRFLDFHGTPIHIGDPEKIGIKDLSKPDLWKPALWDYKPLEPDEIIVFHPTGATLNEVARKTKLPLFITHGFGKMFVTDKVAEEMANF